MEYYNQPLAVYRQELLAGCREATETLTKAEKTAEGIAEVQAELKEKVSEVDRLEAQLQQKETEIAVSIRQAAATGNTCRENRESRFFIEEN